MEPKQLLGKRRDRAIATLLSYKEREIDGYLSEVEASAFRKVILDQINDLCDFAFDLMSPDQVIFNEEFLDRLESIEKAVLEKVSRDD
jgi:hypothetical protein